MKVALVHDYLREYGGAERVLETLHEMFPTAPVYVAFMDSEALGKHTARFANWDIRESIAAKIPGIHRLYSPLRIFSSYFFESFDLSSYDVIISSTNMYMAKAVLTKPSALHICYCHTPPRSLYGYSTMTDWKKNIVTRFVGELINKRMRVIDAVTARRPDIMIANSKETKERIRRFYSRDSIVVYPPVSLPPTNESNTRTEEYYLYAGRLAYAKHPEIAVQACTQLHVPLKVVGKGSIESKLHDIAGPRVEFLGSVSDTELATLYARAKAVLYPVEDEDFGIVPVESMLYGTPVIAHNSGGPKETILHKKTGFLFDDLTVEGLVQAMKAYEGIKFQKKVIIHHALQFSKENFQKHIQQVIDSARK